MRKVLFPGALLAAVAVVAPATAQAPQGVTITLSPNTKASGTTLTTRVDGAKLDQAKQTSPPKRVQIAAPVGMRFDPKAVGDVCTAKAARAHACPAASKVGSGSAVIAVKLFGVPSTVTATLTGYLGTALKGDLAGLVIEGRVAGERMTATGRVLRATRTRGPAVLFVLPDVAPPAGVSARLKSLTLTAGAHRTVAGRVRHLLTTPSKCNRTWKATGTLTFASGPMTVTVPIPCRG